ncbi:hypothetical protein CDO73_08550 [Saccharibacillus sp. O23]|uniref:hypothetical protein n=1 Tax=Saccharibacillus sp. O23 TaxID=2009338 RepID=UPI000B4E1D26|nr:hypothetical protein [Saccharibacillus sp. O23]OWR31176.1 hypothetical protein CDO73_08550 [Saccharibacillus sp. O23]
MRLWLKISLSTLGVCGIALVAWLLLGYTANFQRTPDLIATVKLFMIALPLFLLSLLCLLSVRTPKIQLRLPLHLALLGATILMGIFAWNDARTIERVGWLEPYVQSDTLKITEDGRYVYQVEVANLAQRNRSARLFVEKREGGWEQRIRLEMSAQEMHDMVYSGSDWGRLVAGEGAYGFVLSPTDEVPEADWNFAVDLKNGQAHRDDPPGRDRRSASIDELTPDEREALVMPDHPVDSPRGKFRASMTPIDDPVVRRFEVAVTEPATGNRIVLEDGLRARDNNFVLWDERGRLWIYSGDTGTTVWTDAQGEWESVPYTSGDHNEDLSLPDLLAKLRPALIPPESE